MAAVVEFLTRKRQAPSNIKRTLFGIAVAILCSITVLTLVVVLVNARAVRAARQLTLLDEPPPAQRIVCRAGPAASCVAEVADRMDVPTAWLSPPLGYRLRWFAAYASSRLAPDRRLAFEDLASGRVVMVVDTQPSMPYYGQRSIRRYVLDGTVVQALTDPFAPGSSLTFVWSTLGRTYSLSILPYRLLDRPKLDPDDFIVFVRQVRYATPPA